MEVGQLSKRQMLPCEMAVIVGALWSLINLDFIPYLETHRSGFTAHVKTTMRFQYFKSNN